MYWHKIIYKIDTKEKDPLSRIKNLIDVEEDNSFKIHYSNFLHWDNENIMGKIREEEFIIWRTNRIWNGYFYPIFKGKISKIQENTILTLKVKFNPVGEFLVITLSLLLLYGVLIGLVLRGEVEFVNLSVRAFFGFIFFLIIQSPVLISFFSLKNQTLKELEKYLTLTRVKLRKRKSSD